MHVSLQLQCLVVCIGVCTEAS